MYREMRRKDREQNHDEIAGILKDQPYGVLSTVSQEGVPYGVPLSYVYTNDVIYLHGAKEGQKLDNLSMNSNVSFCVVGKTSVLPEKFSMNYESVIVFGKADFISGEEKKYALLEIIKKYSPEFIEKGKSYIEKAASGTELIKITITHMTGKTKR